MTKQQLILWKLAENMAQTASFTPEKLTKLINLAEMLRIEALAARAVKDHD